jgi:hypothetical protein
MRSQAGSTGKTVLMLSFLIAGAVGIYLSMAQKEAMEPSGGRGADFQPHDDSLRLELQRLPTQKPFTVSAAQETAAITNVAVTSTDTSCDAMLLQQLYLTCTAHRTQMHRDGNCRVAMDYDGGQCAQP